MNLIGVGFAEQDPEGLFHYQRLQLRAEFQCVRFASPCDSQKKSSAGLPDSPEVSTVWCGSSPQPSDVGAALSAGKHVLCGLPSAGTVDDWRRVFEMQPEGDGPRIHIAALHRWDSQLRTVRSLITDEVLGTTVNLHRISRQFVPGELSRQPHTARPDENTTTILEIESRAFELKWFEFLDELLLLVPQPVKSVWARSTGTGRIVWLTLADGAQAHLELHRRSFAPLETGWVIEGTRGGYAAGRRYRAEADYELVDVPVEILPTDQEAFYNSLVASIRRGEAFPVTYESMLRVLTLRDAIDASLRAGMSVDVRAG